MTCQDDATLLGPLSLFCGVETAHYSLAQFEQVVTFAKSLGVTSLFVKVFEVGSQAGDSTGMWYGGFTGWDTLYQALAKEIRIIPYGFLYGNTYGNIAIEIATCVRLAATYGVLCLDMEGSYWTGNNGAAWAAQVNTALIDVPAKIFLSHPADPLDNDQGGFLHALSPSVNVWMPMAYNDHLASVYHEQIQQINPQACIMPTFDISQEFGANNVIANVQAAINAGALNVSLWYSMFAEQNPELVQAIKTRTGGGSMSVLNLVSTPVSEFQPGKTEFGCGPFGVAVIAWGRQPGQGANTDTVALSTWAYNEYAKVNGDSGPQNTNGSSIANMETFLFDTQNGGTPNALHFWEMGTALSVANIKTALERGYPVLVTVTEASVFDIDLGRNPYWWGPQGSHIFALVGYDAGGALLAYDTANVLQGDGNLQTPKQCLPWPRRYDANKLVFTGYASIIKPPWQPAIPGPDPSKWAPPPPPPPSPLDQSASDLWNVFFMNALNKTPPPQGTGIFASWKQALAQKIIYGSPMTWEYNTIDETDGTAIIAQEFPRKRCKWKNGAPIWE